MKKIVPTFEEFLNEEKENLMHKIISYEDSEFLARAWYMTIDELEALLSFTPKELKFAKSVSKGFIGVFGRRDALVIKIRTRWIKEIIKSKKKDHDFVPDIYKK